MQPIYRLNHIEKRYFSNNTECHALNDINLEINKGEIVIILGPSGSGKSTMLNLLSGIDSPTTGEIYFNGDRLDLMSDTSLTDYRATYLGFIFQSYNLIPNLTVLENIELGAHLASSPLTMPHVMDIVGLASHQKKYPYQLSGGQMQRVAIARSLIKNPTVLFCDEPTGALDEKTGKKVLESLQKINKEYGTTMIIVTHNPSLADMAHTVIRMNSGKIVEIKINKKQVSANDLRWA